MKFFTHVPRLLRTNHVDRTSAFKLQCFYFLRSFLLGKILVVLIPLAAYIFILTGQSKELNYWGSVARYGFGPAVLLMFVILLALYLIPGWLGTLLTYSAIMILFGLSLVGLWAKGYSSSMIVSGLLPWSDSANYYLDAQRLLAGGWFTQFSAWRPLSPGLISLLLGITGHNLQGTIACLVAIAASSIYLLSREIQRYYGPLSGSMIVMLLFIYFRQRIGGTLLSENLGLTLAALGFAILLRRACEQKLPTESRIQLQNRRWLVLFGIFLVTFALNVRPGTFFVLAALLIWAALEFRQPRLNLNKPERWLLHARNALGALPWGFLIRATGLMFLVFALNIAIIRVVSNEPALPFSNFSDDIYGVASGGKGFRQASLDYPELAQLQGMERHLHLFQITLQLIREHPAGLLQGTLTQYSLFFFSSWFGIFSYVGGDTGWVSTCARLLLYLLLLLGLISLFKRPKHPHCLLMLFSFLGMVFSVPFVPPQDGYWLRLYAPSLPIIAILVAIGLEFARELSFSIIRRWIWSVDYLSRWKENHSCLSYLSGANRDVLNSNATAIFAAALVFLTLAAPLVVRMFSHPMRFPAFDCPTGQEEVAIRLDQGSVVNVLEAGDRRINWMPNFQEGHFRDFIHGLPGNKEMAEFFRFNSPVTLAHTIDLITKQTVFFVVDTNQIMAGKEIYAVCGEWSTTPEGKEYHFFYASTVQTVRP